MREILRRKLLLGGLVAGVMAGLGTVALADGVTGAYRAEGRNPDGSSYQGKVTIVQSGAQVTMNWAIAGQAYSGKGVVEGRIVTVDWGSDAPVIYVVAHDGSLYGTWARGRALELLTPE